MKTIGFLIGGIVWCAVGLIILVSKIIYWIRDAVAYYVFDYQGDYWSVTPRSWSNRRWSAKQKDGAYKMTLSSKSLFAAVTLLFISLFFKDHGMDTAANRAAFGTFAFSLIFFMATMCESRAERRERHRAKGK